eukprot:jgi/Phyca11/75980/gw1.2.694.1
MFLHIPTTSMFYQSSAMSPASGRSSLDVELPLKFLQIESVPDIFNWLNDSFIPQVFVTEDYNGHTLPPEEWGQIGGLNKVLGAVSFQVTRMESDECDVPDFLEKLYPSCYDESSTETEAFLITFDTNSTDASAILAKKKANGGWLDLATQQLQITILTINGELPGYAVTKLQLEFNPGGYIEPTSWTTSTLLDQFPNSVTMVLDILVLFFWAFPDGWLAIDALRGPIVYAYYITVFVSQSAMTNATFRSKLSSLRDTGQSENAVKSTLSPVTDSFEHIANLTVLLRLLATAAVFVLGLRVLNTFRDHVGLSILTRTIASAVRSFRTFSVIFVVIFMAFASAGAVLFGSSVEEFSSLENSTKTCVNMLFNNFDVKTIAQIDYSVAYYWSYMSLMTFVLLNIVLAIVVDAYKE